MAKNLGSKCKLCRRAGKKLFIKGDRCMTSKCALIRKAYSPGIHGPKHKKSASSEFGRQQTEKQKLKRVFGLSESQFKKHFNEAKKKSGLLSDNFIGKLEMRLDNIVYRFGLASSRGQARQLVSHGMFCVNGKSLNIPSAQLKIGDELTLKKTKKEKKYFKDLFTVIKKNQKIPAWLSFNIEEAKGRILSIPTQKESAVDMDLTSVIEFYSRV